MKRPYYFLVLLLILAGFTRTASAQVQATAKLDSTVIRIGSQTQLHLMVRQPKDQKVNFPQLADTISSKILIVNAGKLDTAADSKDPGNITVHRAYTITAFDEGKYEIPAYEFGAASGKVATSPLSLDVRTIKVDTTKAIFDIKQPMAVDYSLWDWIRDNLLLVCSILTALIIIGGVIWYLRTRPKKEVVVVEPPKPIIPLHVTILGQLAELREKKLWQQGNEKLYHVELSNIVRDYLERRYVIKTHEKTTAEIFASLKYLDIEDADRNMLRLILLLADMVKFAKEKPLPAENEQSMDNAIAFVNNTKQEAAPAAPSQPAEGGATDV
ncbi:BatD family protein [Mucilaginibacter myungsuensis]|uniref:Oxygen tolerance protein BatD n=1 Tax=Mucilaginibacter myungsuensis TaxID=649104 RepID=A0A929L2G0_9SPHI|nr:hypothetical protein [Mucilaginibacter myungsuensis]MBE9662865.1 hypothetical protein [Mucilaginibacter myungsuensis]MDN3598285.1 hypothetical protein [Mucilaginibacter myungsuensis]